jgi:hypothetical protein
MKKWISYGFAFVFSISGSLFGQESNNSSVAQIPFELTKHNNIVVKAVLNESDTVKLMFHTASSSMSLIKEATAHTNSVKWEGKNKVNSWGGQGEARYSASNQLEIAELQWDQLSIWENERSGPGTDGKFGPDLFHNKHIEIDFDKKLISIHPELPAKALQFEKFALQFDNDFMFLKGTSSIDQNHYENKFLIHSGYSGSILYDDAFAADHQLGEQLEIIDESELKDSYGNVLKTKKSILPEFSIGDIAFQDVPVAFFEGSIGRQKMSVMGGNMLKRFNIIINAERDEIYLNPNELNNIPWAVK